MSCTKYLTFEIRDGRKEKRRLLRDFDGFSGFIPLFDDIDLQQMLPSAVGQQAQSHQIRADLLGRLKD